MANTAARVGNLAEYLLNQWSLVDISPIANPAGDGNGHGEAVVSVEEIRKAGTLLIGYLDDRGYLPIAPEHVRADAQKRRRDVPPVAAFHEAFRLVRTLEPPGVGAVDLRDCMLLQLDALERDPDLAHGHDFVLERALVKNHLKDLEQNRYPFVKFIVSPGFGSDARPIGPLSRTSSIRTGSCGIRAAASEPRVQPAPIEQRATNRPHSVQVV